MKKRLVEEIPTYQKAIVEKFQERDNEALNQGINSGNGEEKPDLREIHEEGLVRE